MEPIPDLPHPSILVIDDEDLIRWSLGQLLTRKGYAVLSAETGEAGLALFVEHAPDLVLLDLKLPDIDGLHLLPRLLEHCRQTPVIIMTAYGSPTIEQEARKLGASDFLRKPFDPVALYRHIQETLGPPV
jgi:DNA-binding response OmpR family regulator